MGFAFGVLCLAPQIFWAMTPKELDAAIEGRLGRGASAPAMTRAELKACMQRFPDEERTE